MNTFKLTAINLTYCLMAAVTFVGCSRGNSVYTDTKPEATNPSPNDAGISPISTDGRTLLPPDFYNQSLGKGIVDQQLDGTTSTSKALRFHNEASTGSRAILGLGKWHGRPLPQLTSITFDARTLSGTEKIGLALQVDLKCDGSMVHVLTSTGDSIANNPTTDAGNGYTRFTATLTATQWLTAGSAITDPDTSAVLVPTTAPAVSLASLMARFPAICLKNNVIAASGFPAGIRMAAVLFTFGKDTSTDATFVKRITTGADAAVVISQ